MPPVERPRLQRAKKPAKPWVNHQARYKRLRRVKIQSRALRIDPRKAVILFRHPARKEPEQLSWTRVAA